MMLQVCMKSREYLLGPQKALTYSMVVGLGVFATASNVTSNSLIPVPPMVTSRTS